MFAKSAFRPDVPSQFDEIVAQGHAILRYQDQAVEAIAARAVEAEIGGHVVPCVSTPVLRSEVCGFLCKGKPFAAVWFMRAGGLVQFTIASDDQGVDVSQVAVSLGGGGHVRAGGFEAPLAALTFDDAANRLRVRPPAG